MNPEHFRSLILERLAALDADDEAGKQGQAIVKLDQTSVGRLSRMDALQHQAMAQATARRREAERMRLKAALDRIECDEFGYCTDCGEDIPVLRLEADPGIARCAECTRGA
ncbi:TraR/DksA family transcriptional regulator [Falsiruegeria mediterranea]|jgi:RNA polymerase-binding transcription factor|uniref:RNA polymerase-binding transcription factor DksA n=1 Tax=Falsiruegeria mediterranea M17 TaxID=1200281 RepID=A0A2R8C7H7_9RHOB|nr:TraR/DksA C4-type zinc finger protein [Falsiruegeria mediterranea]SPJ28303.1 RNA polymerase-binding transcription factor DksA [Falsiruegeria mediterranea M17]